MTMKTATVHLRRLALSALAFACVSVSAQVFVSSEKDNRIYKFDTAGTPAGSIDVCKRPRHMMFDAAMTRIYVACGDSSELGVVDIAAGKLSHTIALGESPEIFDLSPDGKIAYVSIEDDNVLGAYDLVTRKPLFTVPTGGEPEGVLVMPDGKTAYVTSEVANVVHLVDLTARKVVKNIKVGKRPRRFVLAAGGNELWVSNELDATVSVVDTRSNESTHTIAFEVPGMRKADITPVGMTLSPDGRTMWVGLGRANHVVEVDVASKKPGRKVLVGKRAWGLAMHPDGNTLYVTNGLSDDMTIVDAKSAKAVKTVGAGRVPHSILVRP